MNTDRDSDLNDDLRAMSAEASWLEFTKDNVKPETIAKLCSALSNAARIEGQDFAYVVWGIDDDDHTVVGTRVHPGTARQGRRMHSDPWFAVRV